MSDDETREAQAFMEQLRERLARPMPARVQQELTLAVSIDQLFASLTAVRQAIASAKIEAGQVVACIRKPGDGAGPSCMLTLGTQWTSSLDAIGNGFARVDRDGLATILAVRTLLQI